jgi:hypothetical protein
MQYSDRVLVPFHYFVTPNPQLNARAKSPHFPFFRLPIDIQLLVYESCDAPTLFQLMRTCSRTRCSAKKLFWENASGDYWYYCRDDYLFDYCPRGYTFLRHCPIFAHQITSVEIDLIRLELRFRGDDDDNRAPANTATKAKDFWKKVRKIFPSVQRVVLTGCEPREVRPPLPGGMDEDYTIIETVVQCAPTHIRVFIAFAVFPSLGKARPPRNTLWRAGNGEQSWQVQDADWKPTRVLLPDRRWAVSPLGDFLRFNRIYDAVLLEMRGIEWLMVESYARYAVQDDIRCPRLDCSATYTERGSWKRHLSESGHGRFEIRCQYKKDPMSQLFCYKHTPEVEKKALEARQRHMDSLYLEAAKIQRRVGHGWGPPGSEQRKLFEEEFTAQLKEETLYIPDKPCPEEMSAAEDYINNLYLWFDRGHVYHGCSGNGDGHICYEE